MKQYFLFYKGDVLPPVFPSTIANSAGQKFTFFDAPNLTVARLIARAIRGLGFDVELSRDSQNKTRSIKF